MKVMDNVGVVFVNAVTGRGILNNVVNLQFGTYLFSPDANSEKVDPDLVVSCRLRMDRTCAQQLHEALGELLERINAMETTPEPEAPAATH